MSDVQVPALRTRITLLGVVALGFVLRCWSIGQGLPYTVGVDEPEIVRRVVAMMKSGDLNPHFFDYGGLIIYFHLAVASLRFAVGALAGESGYTSLDRVWDGSFYLWARYATALIGTLLIYVVYRIGLRWGARVALLSAFIAAIQPNLVREAHFALTDTPLTLLVAWTLLLSLIAAERGRVGWFVAAGVTAGLAAATKYSGAFALVMPLAVAASAPALRIRTLAALGCLTAAGVAFLAGAPYSLLDLPHFLGGFAHLAASYNQPRPASSVAGLYIAYLRNSFAFGIGGWSQLVGWGGILVALAGFVSLFGDLPSQARRPGALAVLSFAAAYFWVISHQSLVYARYALPLVPIAGLAFGIGFAKIADLAWQRSPAVGRQAVVALLLVMVPPVWQAVTFDLDRRQMRTAELLARWLERNVAPADGIVVEAPSIVLPPAFHLDYTPALTRESLDDYRARGVKYLVSSSEKFDPARAGASARDDAYRRLVAATQIATIVPRTNEHPGPTFTVLKIPGPEGDRAP